RVTVAADEVSMAIGRGGQNIRLASRLVGYEIDVYRDIKEEEEDIDIEEFADVIPSEILQRLHNIGCDSAKAVLELSASELARRAELEAVTAEKIMLIMKAEFDEEAAAALAKIAGTSTGDAFAEEREAAAQAEAAKEEAAENAADETNGTPDGAATEAAPTTNEPTAQA
ncbi:MAG: transcription termination/antitermination protein NusA, partial [Bacteroidota bacterium]